MERVIAIIGAPYVGKTIVANKLAEIFNVAPLSVENMQKKRLANRLNAFNYKELADDLHSELCKSGKTVVDVNSEVIVNSSVEELSYLRQSLTIDGKPPIFVCLQPSANENFNNRFLQTMVKTFKHLDTQSFFYIRDAITSINFNLLNPIKFYTVSHNRKIPFTLNSYYKYLEKMAVIISEIDKLHCGDQKKLVKA